MDRDFYQQYKEVAKLCGAVLTSCLIIGNMLYCVNLGDCRAVLCRDGKAVNLSVDHKCTLWSESQKIRDRGGYVQQGRL